MHEEHLTSDQPLPIQWRIHPRAVYLAKIAIFVTYTSKSSNQLAHVRAYLHLISICAVECGLSWKLASHDKLPLDRVSNLHFSSSSKCDRSCKVFKSIEVKTNQDHKLIFFRGERTRDKMACNSEREKKQSIAWRSNTNASRGASRHRRS